MKYQDVCVEQVTPLCVRGKRIGTLLVRETSDRRDSLAIAFDNGISRVLEKAVDNSQQLDARRVFVIDNDTADDFILFGGEKFYRISSKGMVLQEYNTPRKWGDEEYRVTEVLTLPDGLVFIYESGVVLIKDSLDIGWHLKKYWNDFFVEKKANWLWFTRDHESNWAINLDNGETDPADYL